jgi:FlaA1/EpsC-like NDP-sugar epimerase
MSVRLADRWGSWRHLVQAHLNARDLRERASAIVAGPTSSLRARIARQRYLLAFDLVGIAIAGYLALALRFDSFVEPLRVPGAALAIAMLLATRTVSNIRLGLYRRRWRFASVPDLERIAVAVLLGSILTFLLFYGALDLIGSSIVQSFPHSFWVIEALLSVSILGGTRFAIRALYHHTGALYDASAVEAQPALLYGAGQTGVLIARSAERDPRAGYRPVGFLDDDPRLAGHSVAGHRVFGGLGSLQKAVAQTGARTLLITMPQATGDAVRNVFEAALELNLEVRTVPSLGDLLNGSIDAHRIRRIRVEDLLRRPMVTEHTAGVEELIRDRTVVITGGGGSIGSELARQVFAMGPRRLVLVDRAETPLYLVERELESRRRRKQGSGEVRVHLANVASRAEMRRFIRLERPDIIIHTAAYKHVPLMEEHPSDAVHVNIGGTMVMLDAALEAGVERFVFVSTDKAVRPSSVMGATKRVAELLVAETAARSGRAYISVRFGNVLGSNGSVVPILRDQLENGEPLSITDPEMTRFFMTIPEAAWLILNAAALGQGADMFVLDMGEPIRVLDLARDLVRLAGRDPDSHPVDVVGLRPGEKLHEELFYETELAEPTTTAKVLRAHTMPPPSTIREDAVAMLLMATGADEPGLRRAILDYARGLEALSSSSAEATNGHHAAGREETEAVLGGHEETEAVLGGRLSFN